MIWQPNLDSIQGINPHTHNNHPCFPLLMTIGTFYPHLLDEEGDNSFLIKLCYTLSFPHAAAVSNVCVKELTSSAARVSWNSIDLPDIVGYRVFYSQTGNRSIVELTTDVSGVENSADVSDLERNVEYQFQVAAIVEVGRMTGLLGTRSVVGCIPTLTIAPTSGGI